MNGTCIFAVSLKIEYLDAKRVLSCKLYKVSHSDRFEASGALYSSEGKNMKTETTMRLFDVSSHKAAYNMGYVDGSCGRVSRENTFRGEAFIAYAFGYAKGGYATVQIWNMVG